jgi:predicted permease
MATLLQDVRYAVRLLWKHRGFTAIATLVLALGIGANSAVFTIVNTMLLKPRVGQPAGELTSIYSRDTTKPDAYRSFSWAEYEALRQRKDVFASLSAHNLAMVGMREGDTTRRLFADMITSDFFQTFGTAPIIGRAFTPSEEKPGADVPVAIISDALWQRMGGTNNVLSQTITLDNRTFNVVGVAPRGFGGKIVVLTIDVFVPLGMYDSLTNDFAKDGLTTKLSDPHHYNLFLEGQFAPGVKAGSLPGGKFQSLPSSEKDRDYQLTPMGRFSISTSPQSDSELLPISGVLLGMSLVVLFIASFNLANMLLARNGSRAKEFAIRMAIGGSRGRVVRQLITEGFMLSVLGGIGGLALAAFATRLMTTVIAPLLPITMTFDVAPDYRIIAATFAFCLLSTIIFSLGPALRLARTNVVPELKENAGELSKRSRFAMRDMLVMGQLALSLVMLTTAGLFVRGAVQAANVDPGFTFKRGVMVNIDASLAGRTQDQTRVLYQRVVDAVRRVPGVQAAGFASIIPFGEMAESRDVQKPGATIDGARTGGSSMDLGGGNDTRDKGALIESLATTISTGYFDALGLKVKSGRDFTETEVFSATPTHVAIIDDVLATKLFGQENAVGQQIQYRGRQASDPPVVLDVVGVVPGLKHNLKDKVPGAHLYTPLSQDFRSDEFLHVRTGAATPETERAMLPVLREILRAVDESLPVLRVETRQDYASRNLGLAIVRLGAAIFGVFGAVALVLATIGVYGVKSYIVSRRTREIGIRMALGASSGNVVSLIVKEGIVLSSIGLALGLGLSILAGIGVSQILFQGSGFDPLAIGVALAVLIAATLVASWLPARRATAIPPTTALRS